MSPPLRWAVGDRARLPLRLGGDVGVIEHIQDGWVVAIRVSNRVHVVETSELELPLPRSAEEGP